MRIVKYAGVECVLEDGKWTCEEEPRFGEMFNNMPFPGHLTREIYQEDMLAEAAAEWFNAELLPKKKQVRKTKA